MRPLSASLELVDLDDAEEEFLRMRFTRRIQDVDEADASMYFVQGFDPDDRVMGEIVRLDEDSPNTLIIGFPAGTDLLAYPVAGVMAGAVLDVDGEGNMPGVVRLRGSRALVAANTVAPELQSVRTDPSLDRAEFTYDEMLDEEQSGNAAGLGFYTDAGTMVEATNIIAVNDDTVIAEFDEADAKLDDAARFFSQAGSVIDRQGDESLPGTVGTITALPDLVSVRRGGNSSTEWVYRFDEPVQDPEPGSFTLYSADGDSYTGEIARLRGPREVQVTYPEVRDFAGQIAVASVAEGAVGDLGSDGQNTLGSADLRAARGAVGLTAGPDLTAATVKPQVGEVTYSFDEAIDEDSAPDPTAFHIVTTAGTVMDGEEIATIDEDRRLVRVLFPEAATETAAAFIIDSDAVVDLEGNGNILQTRIRGGGGQVLGQAAGPGGAAAAAGITSRLGGRGCTRFDSGCR
jgi:hypothetical protein